MTFEIRLASQSDTADWARMRHIMWDDTSLQRHLADIEQMLRHEKSFGYIVTDAADKPIGFAEICIRDYANGCTQQPVPFLEGIWIEEAHRRSGVGRALITRITEDLVAQGFVELCSDILESNHQSHQAHENWGFEETERVVYFRKAL